VEGWFVVDPVTLIVGAVIAGASSGLKETTKKAISDAYAGLKRIISDRYGVSTAALENKPESDLQRGAFQESLEGTGAGADAQLVEMARAVLEAIQAQDADAAKSIGVDLTRIEAGEITIEGISASGGSAAVKATDVKTEGAINIKDVHTTGKDPDHP
jgi:hypothetical protein